MFTYWVKEVIILKLGQGSNYYKDVITVFLCTGTIYLSHWSTKSCLPSNTSLFAIGTQHTNVVYKSFHMHSIIAITCLQLFVFVIVMLLKSKINQSVCCLYAFMQYNICVYISPSINQIKIKNQIRPGLVYL